jgi:hypothetical protein
MRAKSPGVCILLNANRISSPPRKLGFVSGHDFSRAEKRGKTGFSPCLSCPIQTFSAASLAPEGIFLSRIRELRGWKKRTSAAKPATGGRPLRSYLGARNDEHVTATAAELAQVVTSTCCNWMLPCPPSRRQIAQTDPNYTPREYQFVLKAQF